MIINNEIFESFLNCKYKAYLKLSGSFGSITEYEIMQHKTKALYKRGALKNVLSAYKEKEILDNPDSISAFENGKKVIINAHINYDGLELYCDFMEKNSGKSDLGTFHYIPVLLVEKDKLSKKDKLMITYASIIIGHIQNRQPEHGKIIYGKRFIISKIKFDGKLDIVVNIINNLKEYYSNGSSPQLILNHHVRFANLMRHAVKRLLRMETLVYL